MGCKPASECPQKRRSNGLAWPTSHLGRRARPRFLDLLAQKCGHLGSSYGHGQQDRALSLNQTFGNGKLHGTMIQTVPGRVSWQEAAPRSSQVVANSTSSAQHIDPRILHEDQLCFAICRWGSCQDYASRSHCDVTRASCAEKHFPQSAPPP